MNFQCDPGTIEPTCADTDTSTSGSQSYNCPCAHNTLLSGGICYVSWQLKSNASSITNLSQNSCCNPPPPFRLCWCNYTVSESHCNDVLGGIACISTGGVIGSSNPADPEPTNTDCVNAAPTGHIGTLRGCDVIQP